MQADACDGIRLVETSRSEESRTKSMFRLHVHVDAFKAGLFFPEQSADVHVHVHLPETIARLLQSASDRGRKVQKRWKTGPCSVQTKGTSTKVQAGSKSIAFEASPIDLALKLSENPTLVLAVWKTSTTGALLCLGRAHVSLDPLLKNQSIQATPSVLEPRNTRGKQPRSIGQLQLRISLEETNAPGSSGTSSASRDSCQGISFPELDDTAQSRTGSMALPEPFVPAKGCESHEYTYARELESWMALEKKKWIESMKQKEQEVIGTLENEWKRQELRRGAEVDLQLRELTSLEKKLREKLHEVEDRDRKIAASEEELLRHKAEIDLAFQSKCTTAQQTVGRLQKEFEHELDLACKREQDALRRCKEWEGKAHEAQLCHNKLMAEFEEFKNKYKSAPETELRGEVFRMNIVKDDLERRLKEAEAANDASKAHIKSLQDQLFREIRSKEMEEWKRIAIEQNQNESLTSTFYATTEIEKLGSYKKEIASLKDEFTNMYPASRPGQASKASTKEPSLGNHASHATTEDTCRQFNADADRLLRERNELLCTGLYTQTDPVIQELDRRIFGEGRERYASGLCGE